MLGRGMMRMALRPSVAIRRGFQDVAKTALENVPQQGIGKVLGGVPAGKLLGGAKAADKLRSAASAAEDDLLNKAASGGTRFTVSGLAQPVLDAARSRMGRPLNPAEEARVIRQVQKVADEAFEDATHGALTKAPATLHPLDVKVIKQYAQDAMKGVYNARERGVVRAGSRKVAGAVAASTKAALETIPGVAEQTAKTQSLIGLSRASSATEARSAGGELLSRYGPRAAGAAIGGTVGAYGPGTPAEKAQHGAIGALGGLALTSPEVLSTLALAANNPILASFLQNILPRTAQAGYEATR